MTEHETGAAEPVADWPHCGKPLPLCICDSVAPIENRISLLIPQHPQEQDRALGTARLTARHFKDAVVRIGLSWPSLSKALGRPVARWIISSMSWSRGSAIGSRRSLLVTATAQTPVCLDLETVSPH
jgi:hypothetical protein